MFGNDSPPEGFDHSVESFIAENLSIFQARWIKIQSETLLKTKVEILEEILTEWFATNRPQARESWIETELTRSVTSSCDIMRSFYRYLHLVKSALLIR